MKKKKIFQKTEELLLNNKLNVISGQLTKMERICLYYMLKITIDKVNENESEFDINEEISTSYRDFVNLVYKDKKINNVFVPNITKSFYNLKKTDLIFSYEAELGELEASSVVTYINAKWQDDLLKWRFNKEIYEMLIFDEKFKFQIINLVTISKFSSVYSIIVFELVNKWKNSKSDLTLDLEEFKSLFSIKEEKKYERIGNFRNRVLTTAMKDINEYTDLDIDYELIRIGRNYKKIKFKFSNKSKKIKSPSSVEVEAA